MSALIRIECYKKHLKLIDKKLEEKTISLKKRKYLERKKTNIKETINSLYKCFL